MENMNLDTQTHPLRKEAPQNCASLPSAPDYELGWRAVKGQDESCLNVNALDSFPPLKDPAKEKKIWRAATSALTFTTFS
jgi:hypothetical protein